MNIYNDDDEHFVEICFISIEITIFLTHFIRNDFAGILLHCRLGISAYSTRFLEKFLWIAQLKFSTG
jgi:hypothetical protein